jgi:ABC-2 type transport system ATP-binding protein
LSALRVTDLTVRLGGRRILDGLAMEVHSGDVYGFLGPNGSGKTTALRAVLGLCRRDRGRIEIQGEVGPAARRFVGAMVDAPAFSPWTSGRAALSASARLAGVAPRAIPDDVDRVLTRVSLLERGADRVGSYSLGMRQRLALARALLGRPRLLLLDEPTNGLDPAGMRDVRELLRNLALLDGLTVLLSSHNLAEVASACNRVGVLRAGRLVAEGLVADLLRAEVREVDVAGPVDAIDAALRDWEGALSLGPTPAGRVRVRLRGATVPDLVRRLVASGVDVGGVWPDTRNLEDVYVELTR